ncbi:unnamed protein product [Caenorhabditis sp. 36 PRJEB53466]|nr:unnamed protein product [Caenorhabditis sp. 36 PRJEB53466]
MNASTSTTLSNGFVLDFVGVGEIEFPEYNSAEYWGREVPFAAFISIYCSFFIVLQILVMRVMITDKDLKKLPAFQIIGAGMNASWVSMLILSILLNVNRLISIVFHFQSSRIFGSLNMKIYFLFIILIWSIVFFLNAFGLSRMVYLLPAYTWHYAASNSLSAVLRTVSADISLVDVLFSLVAHLSIFSYIYLKAALLSRKEFILTVQVLCVSIFHILGYVTWEYLPIPWELPIGVFLGHFVWMLWNSINPMLYFLINPRIRNLVLASIGKQVEVSGRTLFVPSHVSTVRQSGAKV